ncbi:MAG: FG-GAP-like repeat-containing protein [Cyclobacteriaceae bacterium]
MRLRLLFLPALFLVLNLQAQTPVINWIKKNGPLGGEIMDIEVDPSTGKIFLLDADNRPFVSLDSAETWQKLVVSADNNYFNDIEITNNAIFFVGGYNLLASVDGGASFQERMTQVSPYSDARRLKRMPTSGNLVVLSYGSIYTSSNNGETWTLRNSTVPKADRRYLEVNAVDQIFILNQNASFETRPFRSTNSGVSFSEVSTGIPAGHQVLGVYGENNGAKIYCITPTNVFSSTNGASWASVKTGITDATINDYGSYNNAIIEFSADGLGMFFIDNVNKKLYSKTLAAATWEVQATDFPSVSLSVSCASAKDYPGAITSTAFFGTPSGVFKTTTGGASITENNIGIASVQAEQILADNNNYLYIRTNSLGLLKSQDGGNNWANVPTLSSDIRYFFADDDGYPLYAVVDYNILKRSYDQGASWNEISPLGGFIWAASPGDGQVFGLAHTSYPIGLYYSADNGSTWTVSPVAITGLPAQFSLDESKTAFASSNRMIVNLWDYSLSAYVYYKIDFTYNASNVITAAAATKITTIPILFDDINKVAAANGKFYLFDNYSASSDRVAISSDGGTSWVTRTVPATSDFFRAKNGYLFFVDGGSKKVHVSRDDAATFIETTLPATLNVYNLNDITIDNNGYAYLTFYGDYLYQSANTIVLPSPLTDLKEIGKTATAVALDWKDLNRYDRDIVIERSANGIDFVIAGQASGWNTCYGSGNRGYFVDQNLQAGTTYTYRVKAKNAAGTSAPTSTISVTTTAACAQTIPENRSWSALNVGGGGYSVLGAPVTVGIKHLGGGKYQISNLSLSLTGSAEISTFFESCGQTVVGEPGNVNPNGNGTWNGTTLTLKWRSCNDNKTETISLSVNPTDPIPAKPASLLAYVVSNTSIEVTWTSAYYEKRYFLERSLSAASGFTQIATIDYPGTTYTDSDPTLSQGTTYYYRIKALNANSTPDPSPYSDVVSIPFNKPNFVVADNAITNFSGSATLGSIWADFNNDGLEDYLTMQYDAANELTKPMIFKNLGTGDFEQILPDIGDVPYFLPSVTDYDNDGYPDLALSGDEVRVLDIFKGNGDFTFSKIPSGQLGDLAIIEKEVAASSWADINNDGLPDLLLLNGEDGSYTLYRQNVNNSFTKILQGPPSQDEPLLAVWADYDNDGYQDVLIGNLDGAGGLYHNNGNEKFTKITGNGFDGANYFSAAWGDYNNDGNIDLFCGSVASNALYKNNGDGTFTKDVSTLISEANFATSAAWGDYNNDGFLDLMTVSLPFNASQSRLFLRDPSVTSSVVFKKIITEKINDLSVAHYSVATADPDQNGQLDLAMSAFVFDDSNDGILPTENAFFRNNNTLANWSEVKLNPTTGSTEGLGARITLTTGGTTQTREIASASSLVSRSSTTAHFGLGSASSITNIQVRWPNGGVQNYPLPPINQVLVINQDVTGPVISTKTPDHNATAVATTTTLTMVFDEEPFPIGGKIIEITKVGESSPFTSVDANSGTKTSSQIAYTLPVELQGETQYRVTIEAGAFRDRWLNPSVAVGPLEWRFTTAAAIDVTAPSITFTPPASQAKGFGTVSPTITVTDNIGVNTVVLSIRKISGSSYTEVAATPVAANSYSVTLSEGTHFDAIGAEFFITATDLAGNSKRDPADPNATHKVYISYSAAQAAIPTSSLGLGGTKAGWKVFAIPFEISSPNNGFTAIFNELSSKTNKTDYRLITYGTLTKWSEYPEAFSTLSRGVGYFINIKTDPGAIGLFDLTAPSNHRSNLYQMNLKVGWNMVGNPYLTPISWDDVSALNGLSAAEAQLKTYSSTGYSNDQTLGPYEGGFVNITTAKTILIPFQGQTSSGGRRGVPSLGDDISAESWALPMTIRQEGLIYNLGGIGMAPEANHGIDNFDDLTPPRFFDYLEMNFDHPEHVAKRFTREIVPTQQNYTWEFTVNSNLEGMAELTWNNAPLMSSGKDLFLLDVSSQQLVDMKIKGSYRFDPKEASKFRIFYGENLNIAPERVQLGKAFPNPTNGVTTIGFSLPETGGIDQWVTIDLIDALGRTVGTIKQGQFVPGYHEAAFDAKEMVNGFYTYRLIVKNRGGQTTEVNKLIIK